MHSTAAALYAESLKIRRSRVFPLTVGALCLAPLFGAVLVVVLRDPSPAAGSEALRAKAALTGFSADWPSFLNLLAQAMGVGGVVVFGFVAAWLFGREYADRTIKDLLVLPVGRGTVVFAKFVACMGWCMTVAVAVMAVGLLTGLLLALPGWEAQAFWGALGRIVAVAFASALLCPPVAFAASVGRGYLGALGFVILTVVVSQIVGALGLGAYVPWAVPALMSGLGAELGGGPGPISYAILVATSAVGSLATVWWWTRADQTH